jgi:hypothetical protein
MGFNLIPEDSGQWRLEQDGMFVDTFSSKSSGKKQAKMLAMEGDVLSVHGSDGLIKDRIRLGSSSGEMGLSGFGDFEDEFKY